ncbi:MAG TPA: tyrosine-type recombinase/integrase [Jatrophihabitantaceae bacterium]|jgi:integrase
MASIEKRDRGGRVTWRAHYRDPSGRQRNKSFPRKIDAERFLTGVESSKLVGSFIDPQLGRVTVGEWSQRWLAGQAHLKPTTRERYAGILREHITPRWSAVRLADVSHADVQAWLTELSARRQAATVRKVHRVLSRVLALAVRDGRLARNPAAGVNLPRVDEGERRYLTHEQVATLADACGPYRLVVLFLAYTGLRWGEMAALRVGRLELMRRRAEVAESVTPVRGVMTWGTPKGHERRSVPIPRFLVDGLAAHIAGKTPDEPVFTGERGGVLRAQVFQRAAFTAAAEAIGVPGLHPHELRHTAASLAIAAGANVKVVQTMLGHKSATMTLDLYGHLFPDQLDEVADALDSARAAAVAHLLPNGTVIRLAAGDETRTSPGKWGT